MSLRYRLATIGVFAVFLLFTFSLTAQANTLSASPQSVISGGSSVVNWSASGVEYCSLYSNNAYITAGLSGSIPTGALTQSKTYTLNCRTATEWLTPISTTVTVDSPRSISASPQSVSIGGASTVNWSASGVQYCAIYSGSTYAGSGLTGSVSTGPLTESKTYTLNCRTATEWLTPISTTVMVPARLSVSSSHQSVSSGSSTTITWNASGVSYCSLYAGSAYVTAGNSGSVSTGPLTQSKLYTLNCRTTTGGWLTPVGKMVTVLPGAPSANLCRTLFNTTFIMGGFSGWHAGPGDKITPAIMKQDGWNVDGPQYSVKTSLTQSPTRYIDAVIAQNLCTVYSVDISNVNPTLFWPVVLNDGENSTPALDQQFIDQIRAQVVEALNEPAIERLISAWFIMPEETHTYQPHNVDLIRRQYQMIKELDPYDRPVYSYAPTNNTPERSRGVMQYHDVMNQGAYLGYTWSRGLYLWGLDMINTILQEEAAAGRGQKISLVSPQMYQHYDAQGNYIADSNPEFPPSQAQYMGKFVRHDLYASVVKGMRGFMVFSFANRPGFVNFLDYYGAYSAVVREILDLGLLEVFSKGSVGDASVAILSGPATVAASKPEWNLNTTYPSVSVREWLYNNKTYVLLVDTHSDPVSARVSGVPNGIYTDLFSGSQVSATGGSFTTSLPGLGAALFVHSPAFTLTTNKQPYTSGENVSVSFQNAPGTKKELITIVPLGGGTTVWLHTDGTKIGTSGIENGLVTFVGLPAGQYEARFSLWTGQVIGKVQFSVEGTAASAGFLNIAAVIAPFFKLFGMTIFTD